MFGPYWRQELVKRELSVVPKRGGGLALAVYRSIFAATRLKGLGRKPEGVPPTREAAHEAALLEARKFSPAFDLELPAL